MNIEQTHDDAALKLLQEAAQYLRRLPLVPTTVELVRKIEGYLNDPATAEKHESLSMMEASVVNPVGLVKLSARLHGNSLSLIAPIWQKECQPKRSRILEAAWALESDDDEVRFQAPDLEQSIYAAEMDEATLTMLQRGVTMQLQPAQYPSNHESILQENLVKINRW